MMEHTARLQAADVQSDVPILVAIHHTAGDALLEAAAQCARALSARVLLLHVAARPDPRREASARAYLDTLVAQLARRGVAGESRVRSGNVVSVVLEEARNRWVSTIVLGVSRRPAVVRAVAGSISDAIARGAPCPVLLVERERGGLPEHGVRSFADAAERSGAVLRRLPRLETVQVSDIVGSVGRAAELGPDFRPLPSARRRQDEQRLERVRTALERGHGLPPLDLYKLCSGYYVLDGHHRVAAALLVGQTEVEAHVVEYLPDHRAN